MVMPCNDIELQKGGQKAVSLAGRASRSFALQQLEPPEASLLGRGDLHLPLPDSCFLGLCPGFGCSGC